MNNISLIFLEQYGCHFIHASDEFYLMTGRAIPEEERYDGYPQLENGVGMVRLLEEEVRQTLETVPKNGHWQKAGVHCHRMSGRTRYQTAF